MPTITELEERQKQLAKDIEELKKRRQGPLEDGELVRKDSICRVASDILGNCFGFISVEKMPLNSPEDEKSDYAVTLRIPFGTTKDSCLSYAQAIVGKQVDWIESHSNSPAEN